MYVKNKHLQYMCLHSLKTIFFYLKRPSTIPECEIQEFSQMLPDGIEVNFFQVNLVFPLHAVFKYK